MGLLKIRAVGSIMDNNTAGSVMEEWSISMHAVQGGTDGPGDVITAIASEVNTWFTSANARIAANVRLDEVQVNEIDATTGLQITDPTLFVPFTSRGAGGASVLPYSSSYRLSVDNGTRNRRARGGFYVPRPALEVDTNGRWNSSQRDAATLAARAMFDNFNNVSGITFGVYSRADQALYASTRLRVGDVIDNVSRRRNDLTENYSSVTISP